MRPFFPYYGSKWSMAKRYPKADNSLVIEPFAGAAGYSTYTDAKNVILIDSDPIIVGVWDYLLNVTQEEILALPELPQPGDSVDNYVLPQEAKWLIGFWLNRGSAYPKKSRTAYSARTDKGQLNWGYRAKERIATQLSSIMGWSVRQGDFASAPDVDATWFVDPPYEDKGKFYRFSFSEFERLSVWCRTRKGNVIVCENEGATWLPFEPLGSFKSTKGTTKEVVWLR